MHTPSLFLHVISKLSHFQIIFHDSIMNSIDMFPLGMEGHTRQTGHLDCGCYLEHQGLDRPMQATPCRPAVGGYGPFLSHLEFHKQEGEAGAGRNAYRAKFQF